MFMLESYTLKPMNERVLFAVPSLAMARILSLLGLIGLGFGTAWAQCPPAPLATPYYENFDAEASGQTGTYNNCWVATTTADPNWETESSGNSNSTGTGPLNDFSGTGIYVYLETSSGSLGDTAGLISPPIDLTGLISPELTFYYHLYGATMGTLDVQIWDGSSWTSELQIVGQQQTAETDPWIRGIINLSAYTGTIRIKFLGDRGSSFTGDMAIDEVRVEEAPACPQPTGLSATNITGSGADINWNTVTAAVNGYELIYGLSGFDPATGGTSTTTAATSATLSGLAGATDYDVYLVSDCAANGISDTSGPLGFTTLCVPFTAGYATGFENDAQDLPPLCWAEYETNSVTFVEVEDFTGTSAPRTGSQALYLYSSSASPATDTLMAIGPQFSDLTSGNKQVNFWANSDDPVSQLIVGTVASQMAPGSFVPLDTITFPVPDTYQQVIVPITSANGYNGTHQYLAFMHNLGGTFDYIRIDDFLYENVPSCPQPTALSNSNLTSTTVDAQWTENGSATQWQLSLGAPGFTAGTGIQVVTSNNPYSASGLSPNTTYEWYVRAICGPGDTSVWSGPVSFTTFPTPPPGPTPLSCSTGNPSVVFSDEFDGNNGWTGDLGTSGGNWEIPGGPTSTNTGPSSEHSGPAGSFASFEASGAGTTPGSMVSPAIDLSAGTGDAELSFWMHAYGVNMGTLNVGVGTSPTGPFTNVFTWTGQFQNAETDPWINVGADLTPFLGQTIYLEFEQTHSGVSFEGDMAIDLVEVSTCVSCPIPSNLVNTNLTATSVDAGWTENGTSTQWQLSLGTPGFVPGTGVQVVTSSNPYSVSGLSPSTSYDWYVRAICGPGDTSSWSSVASFTTPLQGPRTISCNNGLLGSIFSDDFDGSTAFTGNINNGNGSWSFQTGTTTSGSTGPSGPHSGSGYIYAETSTGGPDTITMVSPAIDLSSATQAAELSFWLHAYGASIGVLNVGVGNSATGPFTNAFSYGPGQLQTDELDPYQQVGVNLDAYLGQTIYLEFSYVRGTIFTGDLAIDELRVETCLSCQAPTNLALLSATDTSATLSWSDPSPSTTQWVVAYDTAGFALGTGNRVIVSNDTFALTGLMANTDYGYYVASICGPGDTSSFTGPFTFLTNCAVFPLPFVEDFEATSTSLSCWRVGPNWGLAAVGGFGASSLSVTFPFYNVTGGPTRYPAESPEFTPVPANYELSLDHAYATFISEIDSLIVEYSLDGGQTYQTLVNLAGGLNGPLNTAGASTGAFTPTSTDWSTFTTPLPVNTNRVRVLAVSDFGNNVYIDNVSIAPAPASACSFVAPFVESFENSSPSVACWTNEFVADTLSWSLGSGSSGGVITSAFAGGQNAVFVSANGGPDTTRLVSPEIDITGLSNPVLTFWYAQEQWFGDQNETNVYYRTGPGSPWNLLFTDNTNQPAWTQATIGLPNPSATYQIAIEGVNNWGRANVVDSLSILNGSSCAAPLAQGLLSTTDSSATLIWADTSASTNQWVVAYDTAGFVLGTGNQVVATNDTFLLGGLMANTSYDYYVAAICGPGDTSAFIGPFNFLTDCSVFGLPFVESFEATSTSLACWRIGANWTLAGAGGFGASTLSVTFPFYNVAAGPTRFPAESPQFTPVPANYELSLDHAYATFINEIDSLIVEYSLDGGQTYQTLVNLAGGLNGPLNTAGASSGAFAPTATDWSTFSTPLPVNTNRVRVLAVSAFGNNVYIDNVSIAPAAVCSQAANVRDTLVTTTSADILWNSGSNRTSSFIEYGAPGFTPGTGTVLSGVSSPASLTGLMSGTTYQVCVYDICGSDTSNASCILVNTLCAPIDTYPYLETFDNAVNFPNCYSSVPSIAQGPYSWRLNSGPTTSTNTGPSGDNTTGLGQYLYVEASAPAAAGDTAYLNLPEFDLTSLSAPELVFWYHMFGLDITRLNLEIFNTATSTWDSVFSIVGQQQTSNSAPWLEQRFDLSAYTSATNLQMRFVTFRGASFDGDVALDDIEVRESPACVAARNLRATNATTNSVSLAWDSDTNITSAAVAYGPVGFSLGSGTQVSASAGGHTVTGLMSATCYDFYVQDSCGTGTAWVGPITVCTLGSCAVTSSPSSAVDDTLGCSGGPALLTATSSGSNDLLWLQNGEVREVGDTYSTDTLSFTNVFDVAEFTTTNPSLTIGPSPSIAASGFGNFTNGQYITVTDTVLLDSCVVRANGQVVAFVQVWDLAATRVIQRGDTFTTPAGATANYQVPINIVLTPGSYYMNVEFQIGTVGALFRATAGASYPYTLPGLMSIDSVEFPSQVRYYYTFDLSVRKACIGPAIQATALLPGANAGSNGTFDVCETETAVDLSSFLGVYDFGGTWVDVDASGALSDSIFDASQVAAGQAYNFQYIVAGVNNCPGDTANLQINVEAAADAGADSAVSLCESDGPVVIRNFLSVSGFGGTWVDLDQSGAFNTGSSILNTGNAGPGTYRFAYVQPGANVCPADTAIITATVGEEVNAGNAITDTICQDDGTFDLNNLLGANATAGGSWSDLGSTGALTGSSFDPSQVSAGSNYQFRYRVSSTGSCPADSTDFTVYVEDCDISTAAFALGASIYPNLAVGLVNLRFSQTNHQVKLEVFDASGKLIHLQELKSTDGFELDLSNWPKGVYTFKLRSNEGQLTEQIIKQ